MCIIPGLWHIKPENFSITVLLFCAITIFPFHQHYFLGFSRLIIYLLPPYMAVNCFTVDVTFS